MKTKTFLIGIAILGVLVASTMLVSMPNRVPTETTKQVPTIVSVSIDVTHEFSDVRASGGDSILDILVMLNAQDPALYLKTKEYSGLGTLVTGMYGKMNGETNEYWQYTVNGIAPQVGADQYRVKNGDKIEWRFAESAF